MKTKSTLKHILKLLCCFCLLICSVFMFTACGGDGPGAQPSKPTSGSESGDGGGDDIELDENGNLPEDAGLNTGKFSDYFSGYTVLTNADGSLMLFDPTKNPLLDRMTSFSTLVDRQIDVLAQDLLYRLAYVYGGNSGSSNRVSDFTGSPSNVPTYEIELTKLDGTGYAYNGKSALVTNKTILTNYTDTVSSTDSLTALNITNVNINDFQKSLLLNSANENYLGAPVAFNQIDAIDGYNMKLESLYGIMMLGTDSSKAWAITQNPSYTGSTLTAIKSVKDTVKLAIAQILTSNYSNSNYSELVNTIDNLGYFSSHKQLLIDYIYSNIIGQTLVDKDNAYAQYIVDYCGGAINEATRDAINNVTSLTDNSKPYTATDCPRLYKGYSVVIPAIVQQALSNTFAGTTTSIYPKFARVGSTDIDFSIFDAIQDQDVDWNLGPMSVNKIVLKPQEGKKLEGFELKIDTGRVIKEGASASIPLTNTEYYADDVVVELKVNVEYVANGIPLVSTSKTIKCDADTDNDGVIKLDSAGEVYTLPNASNPTERIEYFREFHEVTFDLFPENSDKNAEDQYITENDTTITPFGVYNDGSNGTALSLRDMFTNVFKGDDGVLTYDAGNNYVQITFEIVSVKRCTNHSNGQKVDAGIHDENCQYVDFFDYEDIVFDFSISPYDVN